MKDKQKSVYSNNVEQLSTLNAAQGSPPLTIPKLLDETRFSIGTGMMECPICKRQFPIYYKNKAKKLRFYQDYYGDRGRYNFRGAMSNYIRHLKFCLKRLKVENVKHDTRL